MVFFIAKKILYFFTFNYLLLAIIAEHLQHNFVILYNNFDENVD